MLCLKLIGPNHWDRNIKKSNTSNKNIKNSKNKFGKSKEYNSNCSMLMMNINGEEDNKNYLLQVETESVDYSKRWI